MSDEDHEASQALMALREFHDRSGSDPNLDLDLDQDSPESSNSVTSAEWNHVIRHGGCIIACIYCTHKFCGGVTRIRSHLAKLPGGGVKVCDKVPLDVYKVMRERANKANEKRKRNENKRKALADSLPSPFRPPKGKLPFHLCSLLT